MFRDFINRLSWRGKRKQNKNIMMMRENEKSLRALAMLRYQANRYQSAGNGLMCQRLNAEIRRLLSEMNAGVEKN